MSSCGFLLFTAKLGNEMRLRTEHQPFAYQVDPTLCCYCERVECPIIFGLHPNELKITCVLFSASLALVLLFTTIDLTFKIASHFTEIEKMSQAK